MVGPMVDLPAHDGPFLRWEEGAVSCALTCTFRWWEREIFGGCAAAPGVCSECSQSALKVQLATCVRGECGPELPILMRRCRQVTCSRFAEKLLNFIIAEVIRHHETIAEEAVTSEGTSS